MGMSDWHPNDFRVGDRLTVDGVRCVVKDNNGEHYDRLSLTVTGVEVAAEWRVFPNRGDDVEYA